MFKPNFLRTLSAGAACLALAGCCANSVCLCKDEQADALAFSFQIGGPGGFAATDVDTLLVTRITNANPTKNILASRETKLLTYALTTNGQNLVNNSFVINNAAPFASAGRTTKLNAYDYRIVAVSTDISMAGRKVVSRFVFKVDSIKLAGDYKAKGCCTCYENESKRFVFNPIANDTSFTSRTPKDVTAPVDAPIITVLKKTP